MSVGGTQTSTASFLGRWQELVLPFGFIASVLVIMVPLPSELLDFLLAANVSVAVVMLLTTIFVRTPLELNIFPTLLLATTLGRLVLNVATTRLILTKAGSLGLDAAGGVVRSFGEFVAGNRLVVGIIIFVIVVVIQFVVITKGATRISEVAARFALDGMPGRQMAIDADMNAGIIDEHEAQRRRDELTRQADFFAAMDGASKFVRGDAIAGIIITLVNIIGGLFIGVVEDGMALREAAEVFTKLTIGDGLVSQVPAFLIALAAGLLVTRSHRDSSLPSEFMRQLFARPQALAITAGFLGILVFTNLPRIPLLALAGTLGYVAFNMSRKQKQEVVTAAQEKAKAEAPKPAEEPKIEKFLAVDPMELSLGVGLVRLADASRGGDLLPSVQKLRAFVATELGILMPKVRIRDNMRLSNNQYRIRINDMPVADGNVQPAGLLAIDSGMTTGPIDGIRTTEPARGGPAVWIDPTQRSVAESLGYSIVDPTTVLTTHLTEVVREHAADLLTRDATKGLIDELKTSAPTVVEELIPTVMKLAEVQQILQMLLREKVPIRQLALILETLGDHAPRSKDPVYLTEAVRARLARAICNRYRDPQNRLFVITLDPALEDRIKVSIEQGDRNLQARLTPAQSERLCRAIGREAEKFKLQHRPPVLLVSPQIRPAVRQLTAPTLKKLAVLSYNEITTDTVLDSIGQVIEDLNALGAAVPG